MKIENHKEKFDEIINKYNLAKKAEEISEYLIKHQNIDVNEFSKLMNMDVEDSKIFLSFIEKGLEFKKHGSSL